MRRGFSIFLVLFFGLGPLSALIDGTEDASLPPCCRRHGAHHCAMYAQKTAMRAGLGVDPRPAFSDPLTCPNYPGPTIAMLMPSHAVTAAVVETIATWTAASQVALARYASAVSAPLRAHAGRGPPATTPCC
jgi:hypothetical protein